MKFPTIEEFAKNVAEKALDEYEYEGKTLRQWVEILKDYDDKQTTLQRIVERLEDEFYRSKTEAECCLKDSPLHFDRAIGYANGVLVSMEIVKKEGGLNE